MRPFFRHVCEILHSGFDANGLIFIILVICIGIHNHRIKTRYNNGILLSGIEKLEC